MSAYSPNHSDAASSSHPLPYFAPASILRVTHSPDDMLRTISTDQLHDHTAAPTVGDDQVKPSPPISVNGHARNVSVSTSSALAVSPAELEQGRSAPNGPSSVGTTKSHAGEDGPGEVEGDTKGEKGDKRAPQRARTGCLTCRRRKVKCDEGRPRCARCKIKQRECVWPGEGPYSFSKRKASSSLQENVSPDAHHNSTPGSNRITLQPPPFSDTGNASVNAFNLNMTEANLDNLSFTFPIDPFAAQLPNTLNPNAISHPFDPSSYLDLLPMLPAPQTSRFYVPPDFLPKTTQPDMFRGFRSNEFVDSLMAPRKKAEAMADPVFLRPYFPTIAERLVMRHYLLETVHVIMAFECPRRPWNPWIEIHAPLAFDHPPGTSPAADALRAAILAVGAVHMRFRADPNDQAGAWNIVRVAKAKVLGLVRQRIEAQEATNTALEKGDVELILAALLSCTIASSLAADDSWHELLTSVLALVDRLGGASNLIREGTHEHLSSFRFFLEQLAIRDVFGCMTTQMSPSILNIAFSPWFFEAEGWSNRDDEWESVERMFGFSRGMVDVIARCCTLISKMKKTGQSLPSSKVTPTKKIKASTSAPHSHSVSASTLKPPTSPSSFSLRLPPRAAARVAQLNGSSSSGSRESTPIPIASPVLDHHLYAEAEGLMAELGVWDNVSSLTPFHARTLYGNHCYRHAIRIRLLREVFGVDRDDPRVQTSCASIVELGVESLSLFGRITWLTWPIVIAAFNLMPHDPARLTALSLLSEFGQYACFDNGAACRVMTEFYQHEEVVGCMTPAEVTMRLRSKPFLD